MMVVVAERVTTIHVMINAHCSFWLCFYSLMLLLTFYYLSLPSTLYFLGHNGTRLNRGWTRLKEEKVRTKWRQKSLFVFSKPIVEKISVILWMVCSLTHTAAPAPAQLTRWYAHWHEKNVKGSTMQKLDGSTDVIKCRVEKKKWTTWYR